MARFFAPPPADVQCKLLHEEAGGSTVLHLLSLVHCVYRRCALQSHKLLDKPLSWLLHPVKRLRPSLLVYMGSCATRTKHHTRARCLRLMSLRRWKVLFFMSDHAQLRTVAQKTMNATEFDIGIPLHDSCSFGDSHHPRGLRLGTGLKLVQVCLLERRSRGHAAHASRTAITATSSGCSQVGALLNCGYSVEQL